ncbi:MAG: rhodanese-like domain-containing protein [Desulfatiglandaceae bacterium]
MNANKLRNNALIFSVLRQVTVILFFSSVVGLLMNQARSNSLPLVGDWAPEVRLTADGGNSMIVSLDEARDLCLGQKSVFLDARSPEDYVRGHIRCAQNIPWQSFDQYFDRIWDEIPENAWIVTYCDGEHCSLSENLAKELFSMGYEKVRILINGWSRWVEAGLPVETGA